MIGSNRVRRSAALFVAGLLAVLASSSTAGAASSAGGATFGLNPTPLAGKPRGYFSIDLPAGHSATETILVYDESKQPENLKLVRAIGRTATNSGDSYLDEITSCKGAACWLTALPTDIHLAGRQVEEAAFRVSVPAGTAPGQYLAGVTAEPAKNPKSVLIGRRGHTTERAVIINQVTVGVAVTVGSLSKLRTKMTIPTVSGGSISTLPRLEVHLANPGQTFSHAAGSVSCKVGSRTVRYALIASTVLPGQQAVIPANAQSIGFNKTVPCVARMIYGHNQVAVWSGLVRMPATVQPTKTYHTGNGVYTSLPARNNGIPSWAIAVIVIGSLCLVGMGGMAFWILRRGGLRRA